MPKDLNIENPLDNHLKPVKDSDGTDSALEISTEDVRVKNLTVSGTTTGISGSDDTKLPLAGGTVTGDITMSDAGLANVKEIIMAAGEDGISLDGGSNYIMAFKDEDNMASNSDSAICSQQSIKAYVDASSGGGGGGGTSRWSHVFGGYKTANGSDTLYYFQYYPNRRDWSNSESSPTSITDLDMSSAEWIAPANGTITRLDVILKMSGTADDLKFYVYKGSPSEATAYDNLSLTLLATSDAVGATTTNKGYFSSTTFSSSNTFSAGDCLFIFLKKETDSGSTHHYFSGTISGEFS